MIEAVSLRPGEDVLELAGGPGTLSLMAANAVGEGGSVICSDFAVPTVPVWLPGLLTVTVLPPPP